MRGLRRPAGTGTGPATSRLARAAHAFQRWSNSFTDARPGRACRRILSAHAIQALLDVERGGVHQRPASTYRASLRLLVSGRFFANVGVVRRLEARQPFALKFLVVGPGFLDGQDTVVIGVGLRILLEPLPKLRRFAVDRVGPAPHSRGEDDGGNGQGSCLTELGDQCGARLRIVEFAQGADGDLSVPASGCLGVFPRVFDWNGDGKHDLVWGLADGTLQVTLNENTAAEPRFGAPQAVQVGPPDAKQACDVGDRTTFDLVDWNNDGRVDLVLGGLDGKVHLLLNEASAAPRIFAAIRSCSMEPTRSQSPAVVLR